jgi:bzd-type benzoyl-CoA reductase N subunit
LELLETFRLAATEPYRDWSARYPGRRAFGYLCTYVPEEIIHAAGFTPIRVMPSGDFTTARADAHLQSYTCSLARSCLDQALAGRFDFLEGVVFPHTCDTMQNLADIWRLNWVRKDVPPYVATVVGPVVLSGPHAKPYLVAELQRFTADLARRFGVHITDEALHESICLFNRQRRLLARLYTMREYFTSADVLVIVITAMVMPKDEHIRLLESLLTATVEPESADDAVRLIVSGATLDEPTLLALIEELGGRVVWDDLCTGTRYFDTLAADDGDPIEALADRYLSRTPCPCKHHSAKDRLTHLVDLAKQHRADGVIFALKKFCDPHAWDYPRAAQALDRAGVPSLLIETEQAVPWGQVRTRVQAFLEMVRANKR